MKRALGPLVVLAAFALAIPAAAHVTGDYKDKFISIGWGGSDGSLSWSGPWTEIHDDNDEKFGSVRVVSSGNCQSGNCINITGAVLNGIGVQRMADVSVIESPELCYDLLVIPGLDLDGTLLVQAKAKGPWTTIAAHDLSEEGQDHVTLDLSDFNSDQLRIRFLVTGLVTTSDVFIDNVEISGELIEDTTTTTAPSTTTTTEGDGGQATTSTTRANSSTTTTTERSTTTTRATSDTTSADSGSSTSTTVADTTTTSGDNGSAVIAIGGVDDQQPPGPGDPPEGSGIRQSTRGLQADFDGNLFGQVMAISPITGVDFQARFSLAVEMIEASWVWIVLLALV
ncbi:MAG TPA: hypothetical protein VI193_08900, partial [Acidimicrobiia bacterium]